MDHIVVIDLQTRKEKNNLKERNNLKEKNSSSS
jgi:hypothetical protein